MKWFLNLTMRVKLFVGFGLMILILTFVIVTAYRAIAGMQESQKNMYRLDFANAVDLKDIRSNQNGTRAAVLTMLLVTNRSDQEALHEEIKSRSQENAETMQRLLESSRDDPKLLSRLKEFENIRNDLNQTRDAKLIPLIYEGKIQEAKEVFLGIQSERNQKLKSIAKDLVKEATDRAERSVTESQEKANASFRVFGSSGILALVFSLMMVAFMNRVIAGPLRTISATAERVASGDLTSHHAFRSSQGRNWNPDADLQQDGGESAKRNGRDFDGGERAWFVRQRDSGLHNTGCIGSGGDRNGSKRNGYNRGRGKTDGSSIQSKSKICFRKRAESGSGFPER